MKKITIAAAEAFNNSVAFEQSNTRVDIIEDEQLQRTKTELYLFDNLIAYKIEDRVEETANIYISSQGFETATTRERLNGILSTNDLGHAYISGGSMYYKSSGGSSLPLDSKYFTQGR